MHINDQISDEIKKSTEYSANKTPYYWLDPKFTIFENLPMRLKYQFLVSMYKELILDCPFFNSFDISFVVRMVPLIKPIKFEKGEFVWKEGDYSSNVYFLVEGAVNFVIEYESLDNKHSKDGIIKKKTNRFEGKNDIQEK
jgi:hyperpolarization activated cyclic nucleotide-gated potassium channel 1